MAPAPPFSSLTVVLVRTMQQVRKEEGIYPREVAVVMRIAPAAAVFAAVGWTAVDNGGYFPISWGWPTLALLVFAAALVMWLDRVEAGRLDLVFVGSLALFAAWTALSALWASGAELPVQAAEVDLIYVVGAAAFLLLGTTTLPLGVLAAVTPVASYALATRLVPDHVGTYNPKLDGYLLSVPIGYQNGLGLLCSLAILVALGVVAHDARIAWRAAAGVTLVILLPTLYFTFSRGADGALLLGLVVTAALDPRRLRYSVALLTALPLPLIGAWLASRSGPLTHAGAPLAYAAHDGHRLLFELIVIAALEAGLVIAVAKAEQSVEVTRRLVRVYVLALALVGALLVAGTLVRIGNPVSFVGRATDAFKTDAPVSGGNLNRRLVTLSSHTRTDYWSAAWNEVRDHPVLGGGANTFRRYWLRDRPGLLGALNAHNLYLETLADLGPIGLLLLVVALATPLAAAARRRRRPWVPAAAGGYVAFLAHAAIDWDWQLPAVTLAALAFGSTVVIAARPPGAVRRVTPLARTVVVAAALPLIAFVFVAQLGNNAVAAADRAADRDNEPAALAAARRAKRWLPWAATPWQKLGEAQLASGDVRAARRSFEEAIRHDDADWASWVDLALVSSGAGRRAAIAHAKALNPRGASIKGLGG
jgi:O-Antigen ligase